MSQIEWIYTRVFSAKTSNKVMEAMRNAIIEAAMSVVNTEHEDYANIVVDIVRGFINCKGGELWE